MYDMYVEAGKNTFNDLRDDINKFSIFFHFTIVFTTFAWYAFEKYDLSIIL